MQREDVTDIIKRIMADVACDTDCPCKREYAITVLNEVKKQIETRWIDERK